LNSLGNTDVEILHRELSYRIVGSAMHVHREIGPGLDEALYHMALHEHLLAAGLPSQYKPKRRLIHRGIVADEFEADLIVDGSVALELKCLDRDFAPAHYTQLICYLKCWGLRLGMLFDFGKESLVRERVAYSPRPIALNALSPESLRPAAAADRELLSRILSSVRGIGEQYGTGYRDTTYQGILRADLSADAISIEERHVEICCDGRSLGIARPACFVVDGRCGVKILALYDRLHAAHRARLQTCLKHLGLPWGILVNYGKKSLDWQYVCPARSHVSDSRVP
ncbi:MAG TPA: GxxExxY protein, partial [Planctomycetaceae bacterium]|nr:GxxExxY protein [Planctomycetaceae bacterium]